MDRYSRTVAFLKVLLPLVALAILATVFLLSRTDDPIASIPFSDEDMTSRIKDQQVTKPFFSGTTPKGEEIMVTADIIRPGGAGQPGAADNLSARLKLQDGKQITLDSDQGVIDTATGTATFDGNVRIVTSTGLVVETERLITALTGIRGNTPGTVTGTGPMGDFTAGNMQIDAENGDGDVHMLFKNGVKLVYTPEKPER